MDVKQINTYAMQLLKNGDFVSAQKMLYLNAKQNPCCQTFNNLGAFLFDNGMTLKNGKDISAVKYAKHYLTRALTYSHNSIVLYNIGRIYYEEHDFSSAYKYFSMSYKGQHNLKILYNMAISLLALGQYSGAYDCFKGINDPFKEMISPYLIAMAICGKEDWAHLTSDSQFNELLTQMDLPDQLLLFYLCNQHQKIVEVEEDLTENWSLNESEWAILIDSLLKQGKSKSIEDIIQRELGHYTTADEGRFYKAINSLCHDDQKRVKIIERHLQTLYFPQIQLCSYYGCDSHNTPWEI